MNFTWNSIELCSTTDKRAHYFVSEAERAGNEVIEINNRYFILVVNEYVWRAKDAEFKSIGNGIYVFK